MPIIRRSLITRDPKKQQGVRPPVTICVAALFEERYSANPNDSRYAVLTASDRMMTDEGLGLEYEPNQLKAAHLGPRMMALVSGDITANSMVLRKLILELVAKPETEVEIVAERYAALLQEIFVKRVSAKYLSRLGLTMEAFLERQQTLDKDLVIELTSNIRNEQFVADALIVGCDDKYAHIYSVDSCGLVRCHDDIGFAAIGIGDIHAAGQFMTDSFTNNWPYYRALAVTYAAKKRAEVAPGVGSNTDMYLINRAGKFELPRELIKELERLHKISERRKQAVIKGTAEKLFNFEKTLKAQKDSEAISSKDQT